MEGEGPLLTIAQISVSLAGFASVVIALRGSGPSAWSVQDRFGLGNVLGVSVATLVASLLPFPLAYLGWSSETVWRVVDALMGIAMLGVVAFLTLFVVRGSAPPRSPRMFWLFAGSGLLVSVLLLAFAAGLIAASGLALLLFGLIWALVAAFAQLVTFVLVTWSGSS